MNLVRAQLLAQGERMVDVLGVEQGTWFDPPEDALTEFEDYPF